MSPQIRHFAAWFGLANIWLLERWDFVERAYSLETNYFRGGPASVIPGLSLLVLLAIAALAPAILTWCWDRGKGNGTRAQQCLAVGLALWMLSQFLPMVRVPNALLRLIPFLAFAFVLGVFHPKRGPQVRQVTLRCLAYASILTAVKVATVTGLYEMSYSSRWSSRSQQAAEPAERRLIWVMLDGFDIRPAFENRPASLKMPEFDALRARGVYADNALSPGRDTIEVLPSMLVGRTISEARPDAYRRLLVRFEGEKQLRPFDGKDNIFAKLAAGSVASSVIGWYHPYCDLPLEGLGNCVSTPSMHSAAQRWEYVSSRRGFPWTLHFLIPYWLRWRVEAFSRECLEEEKAKQLADFETIHARARAAAADGNLGFVMAHYNIPHPYGVFDRTTERTSTGAATNYLDNLALADRVAAELTTSVPASLRSRTAFLFTSDHGFRRRIWSQGYGWHNEAEEVKSLEERPNTLFLYVPPDGARAVRISRPFLAIREHELVLRYFQGALQQPEDVEKILAPAGQTAMSMRH